MVNQDKQFSLVKERGDQGGGPHNGVFAVIRSDTALYHKIKIELILARFSLCRW